MNALRPEAGYSVLDRLAIAGFDDAMKKRFVSCEVLFAAIVSAGSLLAHAPTQTPDPTNLSPPRELHADKSITRTKPPKVAMATAGAAQDRQHGADADSPEFLAREAEVRRTFLERYPIAGRAGQIANLPTITPEQRFTISWAVAMSSRMEPVNQKPPGYWRTLLASIANTQSMGTGLESWILGHADTMQPDPKSVDLLAKQNMQVFKAMAVRYGGVSPEKFDLLHPRLQAQYILLGAKGAAEDILFPCPYTVYLLDEDKQLKEDGDEPHLAREFYERLAGRNNDDFSHFDSYNRQQKTEALQRGFVALINRGYKLSLDFDPGSLASFASLFGMSVGTSKGTLIFTRGNGEQITDDTLIASIFGLDGQRAFRQIADGSAKNDMRAAAFLLLCEGHAVLAPMMFG